MCYERDGIDGDLVMRLLRICFLLCAETTVTIMMRFMTNSVTTMTQTSMVYLSLSKMMITWWIPHISLTSKRNHAGSHSFLDTATTIHEDDHGIVARSIVYYQLGLS